MNLNYKHLHYFLVVAEEGSIARASERLHVAPQTISAQIALLEEAFQTRLLQRVGKRWVVTDSGAVAKQYAQDIFHKGKELTDVLRGADSSNRPLEMVVGITDAIPKVLAYRLIEPALCINQRITLQCYEGSFDDLVVKLGVHSLDVLIADRPISQQLHVKAYNHRLHQGGLSVMAAKSLLTDISFPQCLDHMPFLLPSDHHWLGRALEEWFENNKISPQINGRFDDTALLKTFARAGFGACCVPTLIEQDVADELSLTCIGRIEDVKENYYALTVARKIEHPGVKAICDTAY